MRVIVIVLLLSIFSGCASKHPLLSNEQRSLVQLEEKYLADNREIIYAAIQQSTNLGAFVIIPTDLLQKPIIIPGKSPIEALISSKQAFEALENASSQNCHFIFSPKFASEPLSAPCMIFAESVRIISDLRSENEKFAASLAHVKSLIESNIERTNSINKRMKIENEVFAAALAPTMALVEFNAAHTDSLEKQFKTVSGALATNSATQQRANDLLKDTIEKFAQTYAGLKDKLDEISKKLEAIK